ncbi:MAG: HAMP domain-containing histidine kinase [Oligoflexia bacterium]|nr:HAMP domain-containing histidine kinase [Oligoflexia bacterium]
MGARRRALIRPEDLQRECLRRLAPGSALRGWIPELLASLQVGWLEEREPETEGEVLSRSLTRYLARDPAFRQRIPSAAAEATVLPRVLLAALAFRGRLEPDLQAWLHETFAILLRSFTAGALQDAQEQLEEERRIRKALVSMISHDIRGPLAAIRSGMQLMSRYPERVEARERLLESVMESIDRADRRIQDFIDANRIQAGEKLPLQVRECDLAQELPGIKTELSPYHAQRIVILVPEKLDGFWAPAALRRAVLNLVRNALAYGESAAPIEIRAELSGDEEVRISVHNQGPAMSEDEREMAFRPFRKVQATGAALRKGWGFGLLLTRGLVEAHGGRLSLSSVPGEGTTFTLTLPRDSRPYQEFLIHVA